ncbi:MAG: DUF11 domain-containing protein, partial [Anaerolineales bacterium]
MKTKLRLLMVLVLLSILPVSWPGQPAGNDAAAANVSAGANVAAAAQPPAAAQAAGITYLVEWDINASGYLDTQGADYREVTKRKIEIKGAASVYEPAQGQVSAIPMSLIITDDRYYNQRHGCSDNYEWRSITDPGRYYGGADPFWVFYGIFWPEQGPDGTWSMDNPFSDWAGFVVNGDLARYYNYRTDWKNDDLCGSNDTSGSYTLDMTYYDVLLPPLRTMPLRGDPTGTVFSLNTEYTVTDSYGVPLAVNFHAVVRVGGCKDIPAPIDIANPGLTILELNLQAEDTTPDGEATLQATVTCQGVPVINAPVEVALKAMEGSGGHDHIRKRPRGYIDGMEITSADTRVTGITDSDGTVNFEIRPGRDLTDKSRGIAGWYIADAEVRWEGLTLSRNSAYISAHLDDLVPLDVEDILYKIDWSNTFGEHVMPLFGTPVTIGRLEGAAKLWIQVQNSHNYYLISKGKPGWPIIPLRIWAISLPGGGLLDAQAAMPNHMWRTPFDRHRNGEEVMFQPSYGAILSKERYLWFEWVFRDLGNEYGTWFSDNGQPFNLKITKEPDWLPENSILALSKSASTDPDVVASAALVNPEGRFVAGAGQTVAYSVGVENLIPGSEASQVVLKAALPVGLNFVSADPTQSRMEDSRTPVWDIGSLPDEGAPRTFDVIAQVDPSIAVGSLLTVTATATTSSLDADPTNNQFSDWGLTVQQPGPDLVIGSDLTATALVVGEQVTFTIGFSNDGNAPASNSRLELTAPTGITITETSPTANVIPNGVHWDAGDLAPGGWQTFTVGLQVDPGLLDLAALSPDVEPEYPLPFLMTAGSDSTDIDPASNQMQVDKRVELPGPDLLVALQAEGTPGPGVFEVGQVVTYTLRYANFGNRGAGEVSAALLLWPGLTLMESQPAPTTNQLITTSGVRTLSWNLGELSIGEEGKIELRLQVGDVPEVGSIIQANI